MLRDHPQARPQGPVQTFPWELLGHMGHEYSARPKETWLLSRRGISLVPSAGL